LLLIALMLQANLAEQAGVPSRHVKPEHVDQHYKRNQAKFGALPSDKGKRQAAWEKIDSDIRQELAGQVQSEHDAATGVIHEAAQVPREGQQEPRSVMGMGTTPALGRFVWRPAKHSQSQRPNSDFTEGNVKVS
jgi:hypothetical protein